jgi:hypothetical protein
MGGFYGSVQVRSEDRDGVKAAAESVARALRTRMLIGPVIDGWIGIYPEGSGQNERVGKEIAVSVGGDVLHVLVHDDDILAYWLYHGGKLTDSYWSKPGYFSERDRAKQEAMAGNPEAFRSIIQEHVDLLPKILARESAPVFAFKHLDEFAKAVGIVNAVTSYEYLKGGETDGVHRWPEFEEIPSDRIATEREEKRQALDRVKRERERLQSEGALLLIDERTDVIPKACAVSDGFAVAWPDYKRTVEFARYKQPWQGPEPITISTPTHITELASDASGQRVAIAAGSCAQVWDVEAAQWNKRIEVPEKDLAIGASISPDGRLFAHASRQEIVVTDIAANQRLVALPTKGNRQMAFHPSGQWIAVNGPQLGLISLDEEPRWRLVFVAGKSKFAGMSRDEFQKNVGKMDIDLRAKGMRASIERIISTIEENPAFAGSPDVVEKKIAELRKKMEENIAALKEGRLEPPAHSPENVHRVGFSRDGRWLWCATNRGLRVFEWAAVPREHGKLLKDAKWSFDPPIGNSSTRVVYIHAIAEEIGAPTILFGGTFSTLYQLDLLSGQTRALQQMLDDRWIIDIVMSVDGMTLGISTRSAIRDRQSRNETNCTWEVWAYKALRDRAATI